MSERPVILSCFPGIDGLGLGFQEVFPDACIVRGPDLIFGRLHDVRAFHAARGVFWGVVGGPPCQDFSPLASINRKLGRESKFGNLIPEFERIVDEAQPDWFVMENVARAPYPHVGGYLVESGLFNNRQFGAEQNRERVISVAFRGRPSHVLRDVVQWAAINGAYEPAVTSTTGYLLEDGNGHKKSKAAVERITAARKRSIERCAEVQGFPADFLDGTPFTVEGKRRMIANAVPWPMATAIANAVKRALAAEVSR